MRFWQDDLKEFILANRNFLIQEAGNTIHGKKDF